MSTPAQDQRQKQIPVGITLLVGLIGALLVAAGSIANDALPFSGPFVKTLCMIASSGTGFVGLAILVGWASHSLKVAAITATGSVILALVLYYVAIPVLHLRDGASSGDILRIALIWGAIGLVCGLVVGPAAHLAHYGDIKQRSIATGLPLGLILGPIVVFFLKEGAGNGKQAFLVAAICGLIPLVCLLLSLRRTKVGLLLLSAAVGIVLSAVLFFVVYGSFY